MSETADYSIQLFTAGSSAGEAAGDTAADAVPQISGESSAPDAGEREKAAARGERFRTLIEGEFKEEYRANVQNIIKQRLRGSEETTKRYKALAPALKLLEERYGTQPGDADALLRALREDDPGARAEAGEAARREKASRLCDKWMQQAAQLRAACPGFDLGGEMKNPEFRELLGAGASVKAAYELANRDAIMRRAAEDMREKLTRRILSGTDRPREGGLSGQSTAVVKNDVAGMSRDARREIIRRVQRGEKISF